VGQSQFITRQSIVEKQICDMNKKQKGKETKVSLAQ
jgi:hypothetical protein